MKKRQIIRRGNIQLPCGQAKPGQKLASLGINMPSFCREFNDKTRNKDGIVNVRYTIFQDKTWEINIKTTPTANLWKELAGEKKVLTQKEWEEILKKITQIKLPDLNSEDFQKAQKTIAGTWNSIAKSLGIEIKG